MSICTPRSHQLTTCPFTSHQAATAALHMMISPLRNTIHFVHPIAWYPYPYPYLCSYLCLCPCRCPCLCVWVHVYVLMSIVPCVCFCFCAVCPATCDKCHETCHHATCNAMYGTWYMANVIWNGEHVCLSVAKGKLVHLCTCACFWKTPRTSPTLPSCRLRERPHRIASRIIFIATCGPFWKEPVTLCTTFLWGLDVTELCTHHRHGKSLTHGLAIGTGQRNRRVRGSERGTLRRNEKRKQGTEEKQNGTHVADLLGQEMENTTK